MNLKQLMFLNAAAGGSSGPQTEAPSAFSAIGGIMPFTPQKTNYYGTTINTTDATSNTVTVTQVYDPNYSLASYRNGYLVVVFSSLHDWIADSDIQFDADIDITANPGGLTKFTVYLGSKANECELSGGKITTSFRGLTQSEQDYIEIRMGGCSANFSNFRITRLEKTRGFLSFSNRRDEEERPDD